MEENKNQWIKLKEKIKKIKEKTKINKHIQNLYNKYGYGYDEKNDANLLMELRYYNMQQTNPFFATGQNGYFHEQIMSNGLGKFKLNKEDAEDARFISKCFGKNIAYGDNNIPITYTTLLGSSEFNYGTETFPAGIMEDVFQCDANHVLPIQPFVGESEEDFYLRLLEFQIDSYEDFNEKNRNEVLERGKRLIHNFSNHKNVIYLIKLNDIKKMKASFGDVSGLRDGKLSNEESIKIINEIPSLEQLLSSFSIDINSPLLFFDNPNLEGEYGVALYGTIPTEKIQFIEVERKYAMQQKKAIDLGYKPGDIIPDHFEAANYK